MANDDTLMLEVQRIAQEIATKWVIQGQRPETSWVIWRRVCENIGIQNMTTAIEAIRANLDPDLYALKRIQVGGQMRDVFCVCLADGLPWALMRIDSSRTDNADLIRAIQRNMARIITEILFASGDGQKPASNVRALFGEMTGYTLPLFDDDENVVGESAAALEAHELEGIVRGETASRVEASQYALLDAFDVRIVSLEEQIARLEHLIAQGHQRLEEGQDRIEAEQRQHRSLLEQIAHDVFHNVWKGVQWVVTLMHQVRPIPRRPNKPTQQRGFDEYLVDRLLKSTRDQDEIR
jgi:hypothetical protein